MKLYILDAEKITNYSLPREVSEMFLVPYISETTKKENSISIEAQNDQWIIKSNGNVDVMNGNISIASAVLKDYNSYDLCVDNVEKLKMFCLPSNDCNDFEISIFDVSNVIKNKNITIGNDAKNNIYYNNSNITKDYATIKFENNYWYIETNKDNYVFLNKTRIIRSKINIGDVIFIYGLKIIWMGTFLNVNNPNNLVVINELNKYMHDNSINSNYIDEEINDDSLLFNENDYFFHTPTLKPVLEKEVINIDAPPQNPLNEDMPFILTLGTSLTMMSSSFVSGLTVYDGLSTGKKTLKDSIPQLVMCGSMLIGCLIMPRLIAMYQKSREKKRERKRQRKYKEYLKKKEDEILKVIQRQCIILKENNPSILDCSNLILSESKEVWSREIFDQSFLNVRLGVGETDALVEVKAPDEHFTLDEDNLMEMVYDVVNKSRNLENVPVVVNLVEKNIAALITTCKFEDDYINGLIMQLIAHHCGTDLKIIFFTDQDGNRKYNYIKSLPHCWSDDKSIRFFATSIEEYNEVGSYLENEYKKRLEALKSTKDQDENFDSSLGYKNFSPYYILIDDNYKKTKNIEIITTLLNAKENNGFSMLVLDHSLVNIPNKCKSFIQITDIDGCISDKEVKTATQHKFNPEYSTDLDMNLLSEKISNIPVIGKDAIMTLPNLLSFLEMYNVSKIEQLNIQNRWKENDPTKSLQTSVGVHVNGELFKLDLHEKHDGPHGLVAGSTGSGKSEFIITYILSMAINYHPDEVQFVLIDYKGGGLAGAFENKESGVILPHLAGTITNLDKSEINRTLVSIQSELKRRQRVFNEVKDTLGESTMDIYKYQKYYREGSIENPVSHLFIISDEFAELKSQQPDFMDELISTARIGRSLGVHLILATQKPSGVVNEQIWSNSKFKVCLKVQDRSDSMEMLKKPDAASIRETGRFYLQVGYDDYFDIGQSAWAGAKYVPSDKVKRKIDDSLVFVNNIGFTLKSVNNVIKKDTTIEEKGDQLTNIVRYLSDIAKSHNFSSKRMWLENIPDTIYLNDLQKKYSYNVKPFLINPVIGEYDNPESQEQGLLTIDLTNTGNTLIYGMTGSGKSNLLITMLTSICLNHSPEEVNIYIFDFGAEVLRMYAKYPQVGCVVTVEDSELLLNTLIFIEEESEKRKELFIDYGGTYTNYIAESGKTLPLIVVVINNYEVFVENNSRLADALNALIRDGSKYGISFVFTTSTNNSIRSSISQLFLNKLSLQQSDNMSFRNLLNSKRGLEPKKCFGRGIIANDSGGFEFQTAYICESKSVNSTIRNISSKLNEKYSNGVKKVISLPEIVSMNLVEEQLKDLSSVPIGYSKNEKTCYCYNFNNPINLIVSEDIDKTSDFTNALCYEFSKICKSFIVIDPYNTISKINDSVLIFKENFEDVLNKLMVSINNVSKDAQIVILINGLNKLLYSISDNLKNTFINLLCNIEKISNIKIVVFEDNNEIGKIHTEPWYYNIFKTNNGIYIGDSFTLQVALKFNNISDDDRKTHYSYLGAVCDNGDLILIKYVIQNSDNKK